MSCSGISYAQRNRQTEVAGAEAGGLDRRHLQQTRLFAFLRVARAVRCYVVTQVRIIDRRQINTCNAMMACIRTTTVVPAANLGIGPLGRDVPRWVLLLLLLLFFGVRLGK